MSAVLGEMLELGERSDAPTQGVWSSRDEGWHRAARRRRRPSRAWVGPMRLLWLVLPAASVRSFTTCDDASDEIGRVVRPGDIVLVKGSRGIGTDRIVDRLVAELG